MHDTGPGFAAQPRQAWPAMGDEGVDQSAVRITGRGMNHQAGWLGPEKQPEMMRLLYDRYNEALRDLARSNGIPCIDTASSFDAELDDRREQLFGDTCHMHTEGNVEMGRIIADGLERILAL